MCPGGMVVAAASEAGGVVVNGMSMYQRDSGIANSALVVNVGPQDLVRIRLPEWSFSGIMKSWRLRLAEVVIMRRHRMLQAF